MGVSTEDVGIISPEVIIEPLVCGWHAWTHLCSPLQLAMNVAFRQVPMLRSFLRSPQVHVTAAKDPALFGGPFVRLHETDVPAVRILLQETERRCTGLIRLAEEFKTLDAYVQQSAHGYSLSEHYLRPADILSGLVEFLYDLNNHPKLRIFEELLADENLVAGTQEIMLARCQEEDRPFFMSTPRLETSESLIINVPFADGRIDELIGMRRRPCEIRRMARELGIPGEKLDRFRDMCLPTAPEDRQGGYHGDGVRIRYFGHACVLIQTNATSILVDPLFAVRPHGDGRFTFYDLPERLDYVIISHNHQDHCSPEMLLQIRSRIGTVIVPQNNSGSLADPSMQLALKALGIERVRVVRPLDAIEVPDGRITSLPFPGEHVDLDIHSRQGIYIKIKGKKIVLLVDSDGRDPQLFRRIVRRFGNSRPDALFLGMECHGAPLTWLYGPLLTAPLSRRDDESRRLSALDCEHAWEVVREFEATRVYVYAMGQEPWIKHIMGLQYTANSIQLKEVAAFLQRCREAGIIAERLFIRQELEL